MLVLDPGYGPIRSVAFSPAGRGLAAAARKAKGLLLWDDPTAGRPPRVVPAAEAVPDRRVRFSADGRRVGWQDTETRPVVLDPARERTWTPVGPRGPLSWGEMTRAGDAVVLAVGLPPRPGTGETRSLLTCRPVESSPRDPTRWSLDLGHLCLSDFAFLPDSGIVGVEATTPQLQLPGRFRFVLRELATGRELSASPEFEGEAGRLAADPVTRRVAAVRANRVFVWTPDDPDTLATWKNATARAFSEVAFQPSCGFLLAADLGSAVRVHDPVTGGVVRAYDWQVGKVRCVALSADGLLAAAGNESGKIVVWDVDV